MKCSYIERSDWPTGEETDVSGPSGVADWWEVWSDDSETGGFPGYSQSGSRRGGRRALTVTCVRYLYF